MNQEQLVSFVRQLLLSVGGGLVTKGYIDGGSWSVIATGLATIIVTGGWALYTRRTNGLIASAAANLKPGETIRLNSDTDAAKLPPNVVGPAG